MIVLLYIYREDNTEGGDEMRGRMYRGQLLGWNESGTGRLPDSTMIGWRAPEIAGIMGLVFIVSFLVYFAYEIVGFLWR
jgi:hypothetical protein